MLQTPIRTSSSTSSLLRRGRGALAACFLAASLLATAPMAQGFKLGDLGFGKKKKQGDAAKGADPAKKTVTNSKYFFDFEESAYYTSPDKRAGVKMLVDTARVGPSMASLHHVTLLPGGKSVPHRHVFGTELLYIVKGSLVIRVENETKVLGANTAAHIPPKAIHEYKNESTDVVQFLQVYAPAGPEEEYRNWEKAGGAGNAGAKPNAAGQGAGAGSGSASGSASEELTPGMGSGAGDAVR